METKFWLQPEVKNYFQLARNTTRHWAKSFYLTTQLLPEPKRWATYALYGFCRYADNLVDSPREQRSNGELRGEIQALGEELDVAFRTGESQHPIVKPVIAAAKAYDISPVPLLDLLRGVEMDIDKDRYDTFRDLYLFCYRVAGTVGMMMSPVLGTDRAEAECHAEALGVAMQLTNILRDVQEDAERGRIYIPREDLDTFDIREEEILNGEMSPRMRELMKFEIERARHFYAIGEQGIPYLNPDARFAIRAAAKIYGSILDRIADQDYNPFAGRAYLGKGEKLRVLMKEYVAEKVAPAQPSPKTSAKPIPQRVPSRIPLPDPAEAA